MGVCDGWIRRIFWYRTVPPVHQRCGRHNNAHLRERWLFALFSASAVGPAGGQTVLLSVFTCGINFVCGLYPESTNLGICEMAGLSYNMFFKQWLKILAPVLAAAVIIISAAPYIGIGEENRTAE